MELLKVYELRLKVYLLEDITKNEVYDAIAEMIDSSLEQNSFYAKLHEENRYKNYCFDALYKTEKNGIYQRDKIYSCRIRTVDENLANYLGEHLENQSTRKMKGLKSEIRIIPKRHIERIYSITPAIVKINNFEDSYWKNNVSLEEYEKLLKENLIKKFNFLTGLKINEDFPLYSQIEFLNRTPCCVPYKNIKLLGDKIQLTAADDEMSQSLLYLAIGTGIQCLNARGMGFVNYKFI